MPVEVADYRDLFFSEAHEQLSSIGAAIRKLDRDPGDRAAFQEALRASHTLKGMSATMGYDEITVFVHAFEDLLESSRGQSKYALNNGVQPLFRTLDHLNSIISRQESGRPPGSGDAERIDQRPEAQAPQVESSPLVRIGFEQLEELTAHILELIGSGTRLSQAEGRDLGSLEIEWRQHLSFARQLLNATWSLQMAPIGQVFDRFPQMLHDLARAERKEVRVTIEGREIEVARTLLEVLAEPLLHLLRNAVVHGIEPLSERLASGKYPRGNVVLRACERGDSITIEVSDDGRGLDAGRILQAAHEQDLISEVEYRTLGQAEAYELIMAPGFSLSPTITKASGRGVGMDIVRKQVQALHGTIHIRSHQGGGTTFSLELDRTNGATQIEVIRLADRLIALPASQIDSRQALTDGDATGPDHGEVYVADHMMRLVDLRSECGLAPSPSPQPYGFLIINNRLGVAARVDEFLGKSLWRKPPNGNSLPFPLLDFDRIASK